jgi:PAS domain S-box-containing protein
MKAPLRLKTRFVVGLALVISSVLGVLSLKVIPETAGALRGALLAGHVCLFAVLSVGALVSYHEDRRRQQAEESLRGSESRMRAVLETAVDGIISIDEWGIVERINQAAERMFAYSRAEVVGRNVSILMPARERDAHDGYLARYRATGERKIIGIGREVVCRRKDGTEFPAELAVGEYRVEGQRKFTGFVRDISDRKRAEARIREQAMLLDKARDAIFVCDLDEQITYWNPAAARLYGWSVEEARGKGCRDLFFKGADGQFERAWQAVMNGDEWFGELRKTTRDGREVIVESRWSLLRDDHESPVEILTIESDVTEKKERERQSLRAQRLESIGTLAGGIAHDLNNMLTPILMSAKLLGRERPTGEREGLVANILASAERSAEMIRQLLAFTGGVETERAPVDLRAIVREITSLLEHTLPKSITVEAKIADDLWPICGDATQLSQVLMNLCVNARDAMPGGGNLSITGENRTPDGEPLVGLPELCRGPHVVLTVADTGTGIPREFIDRIFDPFFTTKPHGKGTGLGLSTVLGIVKSHGGIIHVTSDPGRGTQFTIALPTDQTMVARRCESAPRDLPVARGNLILAVDDESFILTAVKATLEGAGYRVMTATGGAMALELFRQRQADVAAILVDMMMPGMDGPATMRALREVDPRVQMIASSGLRAMDHTAKAVAECAAAFLQKPYTDKQLLSTLSKVLGERRPI